MLIWAICFICYNIQTRNLEDLKVRKNVSANKSFVSESKRPYETCYINLKNGLFLATNNCQCQRLLWSSSGVTLKNKYWWDEDVQPDISETLILDDVSFLIAPVVSFYFNALYQRLVLAWPNQLIYWYYHW